MTLSEEQPGNVIKDFCKSTSLHGYSYLYIADTFFMKMVWIFVIIVMTGLGVVFLTINTDAYIKARLVTNIESSTAGLHVRKFQYFLYQLQKVVINCTFRMYSFHL